MSDRHARPARDRIGAGRAGPVARGRPDAAAWACRVEKPTNFRGDPAPAARPAAGRSGVIVGAVIVLALTSVAFSVAGPKLLGNATNILFEGVVGKRLPAGLTKEQVVEGLRAQGDTTQADLVSGMNVVPGVGVDFDRLGHALLVVVAVYVLGVAASAWAQALPHGRRHPAGRSTGSARTSTTSSAGCRFATWTSHARGDLLSRVTNDIDNVNTTPAADPDPGASRRCAP